MESKLLNGKMIQDLEAIEYRYGALEDGIQINQLPIITLKGASLTPKIRKEFLETNIINCGGCYGDSSSGNPVQFDHLKLILTDDTVEIIFINRRIALSSSDDEKLQRINRSFSYIESEAGIDKT